jgi:tRNA pseudouridine13 synthase
MNQMDWHVPYLTEDLPGIRGTLRSETDDFIVEEIPAYDPCGEGEHTFFRIEKRGITTMMLIKQIAQKMDLPSKAISCAGLKDKYAVARQTLCIHNVQPEVIQKISLDNARVLWTARHTNKLRTGHLRGNQFIVRIRSVVPEAAKLAAPILETLSIRGVPNAYGEQRFGNRGDNHLIGYYLLQNDREKLIAHGVRRPSYRMRSFFVSAFQSLLFNQYLTKRITNNLMDAVMDGDIARKESTGGLFTVEDVCDENKRTKEWEISPTGPIYGYKMMRAKESSVDLENLILDETNLKLGAFRSVKAKGSRRPLRYRPEHLKWQMESDDVLKVEFSAPKGAYATALLDELMKKRTQ